jgi:phosphopantetheinyl transferase (holo-ACP synthase)
MATWRWSSFYWWTANLTWIVRMTLGRLHCIRLVGKFIHWLYNEWIKKSTYIITVWMSKACAMKWWCHSTYMTYCDATITEFKRNTWNNNTDVKIMSGHRSISVHIDQMSAHNCYSVCVDIVQTNSIAIAVCIAAVPQMLVVTLRL